MSPSPEISPAVTSALDCLASGQTPERLTLRDAVRALLARLAATAPGRSVEVRVPPYGAIQCVEGPRHTRGTPPNLVETDPVTFLQLAAGRVDWAAAVADGRIRASGIRSDISSLFPIV
ncbi:sterol carrier family protein [Catellatospora sichuanensis]|uniref:sterol carrier family protein n=1 Tax=Catellatospora sichuanensis TaxID=1969805 RepID=UPI001182A3B1|nr:sterol carrier family protein [Catellatospora sichuanensis]